MFKTIPGSTSLIKINSLRGQCLADQILGLCFCLLPHNFCLVLPHFDSILLVFSFVSQPGVWMSFFCSLVKVGIRHDGLGTFFHGFPPDLLSCFSVSEPYNLRYSSVLKSSSSTHPVPKAVTYICRLAMVLDTFCGYLQCLLNILAGSATAARTKCSRASW